MRPIQNVNIKRLLFKFIAILLICLSGIVNFSSRLDYYDFVSFYVSGLNYNESGNPYRLCDYNIDGFDPESPNLNPPISIPFMQVISAIGNLESSLFYWRCLIILFYIIGVGFLLCYTDISLDKYIWFLYSIGYAGFGCIWLHGQIQTFLFMLFCFVLLLRNHKYHDLSGILIGLIVAIKPFFVLWIVYLYIFGEKKHAIVSILSAAIFFFLPIFFYGKEVYYFWLQAAERGVNITNLANNSLIAFTGRMKIVWLGYTLSLILILLVGYLIYRFKKVIALNQITALAMIIIQLSSPIAWSTYTVFLLPFLMIKPFDYFKRISSCIFLVPTIFIYALWENNILGKVMIGSFHMYGILFLFMSVLFDIMRTINNKVENNEKNFR